VIAIDELLSKEQMHSMEEISIYNILANIKVLAHATALNSLESVNPHLSCITVLFEAYLLGFYFSNAKCSIFYSLG